jgi:hypothetical protein
MPARQPLAREGRATTYDTPSPDSLRGEGMRGGGGRRGDERVARSVPPHGFFRRCHLGFRVEVGGGRCTHTCAAAHALGARQCHHPSHHQPISAGCFLLVPAHRVRVRLLCLSVRRRFCLWRRHTWRWRRRLRWSSGCSGSLLARRFPPRWEVAAVNTRPPHALSSLRIRCCETTVGYTSLLVYEQTTRLSSPYPTTELEQLLGHSCVVST